MPSLNRVSIIGNLGQDPELRYTQKQVPWVALNVATNEPHTAADGTRIVRTEWHRVVVWRKQAETCAKYLSKGKPVFIEGRLQTRSWEDQKGSKRFMTEIIARVVQFLDMRKTGETEAEEIDPEKANGERAPNEVPF